MSTHQITGTNITNAHLREGRRTSVFALQSAEEVAKASANEQMKREQATHPWWNNPTVRRPTSRAQESTTFFLYPYSFASPRRKSHKYICCCLAHNVSSIKQNRGMSKKRRIATAWWLATSGARLRRTNENIAHKIRHKTKIYILKTVPSHKVGGLEARLGNQPVVSISRGEDGRRLVSLA